MYIYLKLNSSKNSCFLKEFLILGLDFSFSDALDCDYCKGKISDVNL
jgi:hypothetical protein